MHMNKNKVRYGINDLGQATALVCAGFEVIDLASNPDSDRVTFYFQPSERIATTAQEYWSGKLKVDAKQYWQEMKNLKTRLYSVR